MNNSTASTGWVIGRCDFSSASSRLDVFLFITIFSTALFGNIIVFISYARFHLLRTTIVNILIISIAVSDFLVAILSVPFSFAIFVCKLRPPIGNLVYLVCDILPSVLSIYSLTLLAVDRAISIVRPMSHKKYLDKKSATISVAVVWGLAIFLTAFCFILERRHFTIFIILMCYVIPVSIMVVSYTLIGYKARSHAKALRQRDSTIILLERVNQEDSDVAEDIRAEDKGSRRHHSTQHLWKDFRVALALSFILSVFVMAWTPFIAINIKHYECPSCHIDFHLIKYFKMLHYLNSSLNPLLYVLLNRGWKNAFRKVLCLFGKKRRIPEDVTESLDW